MSEPSSPIPDSARQADKYRSLKAAIRRVGKRRIFEIIEPRVLPHAFQITNQDHSAYDKAHSKTPEERREAVLEAIQELKEGRQSDLVIQICNNPENFDGYGVDGKSAWILQALVSLVQTMHASRNFDQDVFGCLWALDGLGEDGAESLRQVLEDISAGGMTS